MAASGNRTQTGKAPASSHRNYSIPYRPIVPTKPFRTLHIPLELSRQYLASIGNWGTGQEPVACLRQCRLASSRVLIVVFRSSSLLPFFGIRVKAS